MNKLNPSKIVLFSYVLLILFGFILLSLPISLNTNISFVDALFTSTSAVTVTGLIVKDTANDFTFFGQLVIMALVQVGGLGYMTLMTFFIVFLGKKTSMREQMILSEALNYQGLSGIVRFLRQVIIIVFLFESLGVMLLYPSFFSKHGALDSLWYSLFHSITAFNNAGFSLFKDNLMQYKSHLPINLVISLLIFLGGIGYSVIMDIFLYLQGMTRKLSTHTKSAIIMSISLVFIGMFSIIFTEIGNEKGLWSFDWYDRFLVAFFSSVSTRTAGFNTVDFATFSESSIFIMILLMFIGASPGGTGGGIKTITVLVILMSVLSYIKGRDTVSFMKRKIDNKLIFKSMMILSLSFTFNFTMTLLLTKLEHKPFLATLFEVASAFATVGLSLGNPQGLSLVADFSYLGKMIIVLCMIVGKVGILSFVLAVSKRENTSRVGYPDSGLML